jgi:hypothetical protein
MNGRMAMLGLVYVVGTAMATGQDVLQVVDAGIGGMLLK